jgi:hypothetical protein
MTHFRDEHNTFSYTDVLRIRESVKSILVSKSKKLPPLLDLFTTKQTYFVNHCLEARFIHVSVYGSVALVDLGRFISFLIYRQ